MKCGLSTNVLTKKEGRFFGELEGVDSTFSLLASTYLFAQSFAKILHLTRKAVNHPDPLVLRFRLLLSSFWAQPLPKELFLLLSFHGRQEGKDVYNFCSMSSVSASQKKAHPIHVGWSGVRMSSSAVQCTLLLHMWNRNPCECNNGWHGCQLCNWSYLYAQQQQNKHRDRDFIFMETTWHRWRETCFMPGPKEIRIRLPQIINKSWAPIQSDNMFRSHTPAGWPRRAAIVLFTVSESSSPISSHQQV